MQSRHAPTAISLISKAHTLGVGTATMAATSRERPALTRKVQATIVSSDIEIANIWYGQPIQGEMGMKSLKISKAFTLIEPGPVVLITTNGGQKDNVMTITWTMVLDFSASFAITTGPWNYSYSALRDTKECVIAIPTVDLIDTVVGVGTCSGKDTDKFGEFGLTPMKARHVRAPLIKECLANIECRVADIIERHNIIVLQGLAAYFDGSREEKRMIHAVGDGTFIVDGHKIDRKAMMLSKLPAGL